MSPVLLALCGYVAFQLALGFFISRRIRTEDDYLLAGRRLGPVLATFSIFATWFGAETCVGAAAEVYRGGFRWSLSDPFGYTTCLLLFGLLIVVPLYARKLTTLADLFRERYSLGVEKLAALLLIPSSLFWASAQIRAFGRVIAWGTSLSAETGVLVAAITACVYTAFGGLLADAYSDLIQGSVLIVCLLTLLVCTVVDLGGASSALDALHVAAAVSSSPEPPLETLNAWAIPVLGSLFAQELLSRAIASRSAPVARRSTFLAALFYLSVGCIPLVLGAIARATLPDVDPEAVLSALAQRHLGSLGYVLLTGALVSAILSTVDSALLVASSFVSHNLASLVLPGLTDSKRVVVARISVVSLGLCAYLLARGEGSVHGLVSQASAFGSAGVCVVGLMALFTRFGDARAAYASLASGCLTWLYAEMIAQSPVAFLTSLAAALAAYIAIALFCTRAAPAYTSQSE